MLESERRKKEIIEKEKPDLSGVFLGDSVRVRRSSGIIEGGWQVEEVDSQSGKAIVTKHISEDRILEKTVSCNELSRLREQPGIFNGDIVRVRGSKGGIEGGWRVSGFHPLTGEAIVTKHTPQGGILKKTVSREELTQLKEQPGLFKGDEVRVKRSSGKIEGGWTISGFNPHTGKAIVTKRVKEGFLRKIISQEELYELNPPKKEEPKEKQVEVVEKEGPKIEIGADTYAHHQPNQDSFFISRENGLAMVCDGMGGRFGGEVASSETVDAVSKSFKDISINVSSKEAEEIMRQAILKAEARLEERGRKDFRLREMGTTLSAIKFAEGGKKIVIGQVGDSRIYRFRKGKLEQISPEDSYVDILKKYGFIKSDQDVKQEIDINELEKAYKQTAKNSPEREEIENLWGAVFRVRMFLAGRRPEGKIYLGDIRNFITASISAKGKEKIKPHIFTLDVEEGDEYYLVSDGVSDNLYNEEIIRSVSGQDSSEKKARRLVLESRKRMNDLNHPRAKEDDTTAVAVKVSELGK